MKNFPAVTEHGYEDALLPGREEDDAQEEWFILTNRCDQFIKEVVSGDSGDNNHECGEVQASQMPV